MTIESEKQTNLRKAFLLSEREIKTGRERDERGGRGESANTVATGCSHLATER